MPLAMTLLLMHDGDVPAGSRAALAAASTAGPAERLQLLDQAARLLYRDTDLECAEVRDLLGAPGDCVG